MEKIKSCFRFFTDGKQHKAHELDMINHRNHALRAYMTLLPVTLRKKGRKKSWQGEKNKIAIETGSAINLMQTILIFFLESWLKRE